MTAIKWSRRRRLAYRAHVIVNRWAWRYAIGYSTQQGVYPRKGHILWRLNDWLASKWVYWFTAQERSHRDDGRNS